MSPGSLSPKPFAIGGSTLAVGSPADDDNGVQSGACYLYDRSTYVQTDKLLPSDGEANDLFGNDASLEAATACLAARDAADGRCTVAVAMEPNR